MPVILQYLLVLTYTALIFSVSATINSLILTRNFGNIPMLVGRLQEKIRSVALPTSEFPPDRKISRDDIAPWQWRLLEGHCTFGESWASAAATYFFMATDRAIHVGYFRAVSPGADPLIHMDARKDRYQSRRPGGGRVCDASHAAFLTRSSERQEGPREERLDTSPSV